MTLPERPEGFNAPVFKPLWDYVAAVEAERDERAKVARELHEAWESVKAERDDMRRRLAGILLVLEDQTKPSLYTGPLKKELEKVRDEQGEVYCGHLSPGWMGRPGMWISGCGREPACLVHRVAQAGMDKAEKAKALVRRFVPLLVEPGPLAEVEFRKLRQDREFYEAVRYELADLDMPRPPDAVPKSPEQELVHSAHKKFGDYAVRCPYCIEEGRVGPGSDAAVHPVPDEHAAATGAGAGRQGGQDLNGGGC